MKVRYTIHEKSKMIGAVEEVEDRLGYRLIATHCAVLVTEEELAAEAKAAAEAAAAPVATPAGELEAPPADKPAQKPAPKSSK